MILRLLKKLFGRKAPEPGGVKPWDDSKRSPHWPTVRKAHLELEPCCQWCGGNFVPDVRARCKAHQAERKRAS